MSDKNMIMSLESLNKIAAYLTTRPWSEAQPLLTLFNEAREVPPKEEEVKTTSKGDKK